MDTNTMKFGPEWLRNLSDGPQSSGSTSAPSSTRFKIADIRYGREEMLTFHQGSYEPPSELRKFEHIFEEGTQMPISLQPLSEDEERLIAQGVNSQLVMRPGRGTHPASRGGRGGLIMDRGRGRGGRGRGEVYGRGGLENGDIGGGFGRPRGPNKDGWEEVGNRKMERGFSRPFDDVGREGHPRFSRSMSDNWRDKGPADEEDEGDWRKPANRERWSTRTNWREPGRGGHDMERREGVYHRPRAFEAEDRGRRVGEPRESDDVPEWLDNGSEEGSFDASGAFVSNKDPPFSRGNRKEEKENPPQNAGEPPQSDQDRQEGGHQQQREQDDWESTDSSQDGNLVSNGTGGPGSQGPGGREEAVPPPGEEETEAPGGSFPAAVTPVMPLSLGSDLPAEPVPAVAGPGVKEETKINAPVVPLSHENGLKWYYVDPQQNLQGPFSSEDMVQWFNAGYFTMCLKVKRGCDHDFQPLGDLMKQWGQVPFIPGPVIHPPIVKPQPSVASPPEPAAPPPTTTPITTQPAVSLPPPAPIPTAPAPTTFPLGQSAAGGTESLLVQQQLLIQHQILQLQVELRSVTDAMDRQLQMQTLTQLQEQESFKALDPAQQQQVSMHYFQNNPLMQQRMQHLQQLQHMQQQSQQTQQQLQLLSQGSAAVPAVSTLASTVSVPSLPLQQPSQPVPPAVDITQTSSSPTFSLPVSQPPVTTEGQGQGDIPSIWGSAPPAGGWPLGQPTSVWELENSVPPIVKPDLDKMRMEKEEIARMMEVERKQTEALQKQQEELRREAEALQREREQMERAKEELERQRILELQRVEELRRQQEEEQRRRELEEAERRKQQEEEVRKQQVEEQKRREEEVLRRSEEARKRSEEERRRNEEERRKDEERRREEARKQEEEEERRKQEDIRRRREEEEKALQMIKKMEEARQQQEAERQKKRELEKQQEAEAAQRKKELERQQQEALRRMQQQQALQNIQLPSSANWARQQQQSSPSVQSRPLAEIQQEEEVRQLQLERERQQMQRQQEEQQQLQQQQQQQKTWASNIASQQPPRVKTLAEIQEEQARQLKQEKQKVQQQHQFQAKALSLSQAAVWGGSGLGSSQPASTSTPWTGTNSIWGAPGASAIWGNSTSSVSKSASKKSTKENQVSSEFPSLQGQKSNKSKQTASKTTSNSAAPSKSKKEEEAVQRLFKETSSQNKDDFTMWCEAFLEGMEVQVDIETFVSFLKEVDSPYEVHDYVKSYLGESKKAREFGKQFLERRSHFNNKARKEKQQEEESIWGGPAPAVNPREIRGNVVQTSNVDHGFTEVGGKSKGGKKKKKMQKLDGSALLGFTVAKDPNRKNAGEIESID